MLKQLLLVMLVLALSVPVAIASEPTQITFLHYLSFDSMDMLAHAIAQFEQDHKVEVEVQFVNAGEVVERLLLMAAGGVFPDVVRLGSEFISLVEADAFADLAPFIDRDRVQMEHYYPATVDSFLIGGKQLALPTAISSFALFYNRNMFDAAGLFYPSHDWGAEDWTWDDFITTARKLTDDETGTYGVQTLGDLWCWPWWWGSDWLDPVSREALADTPETIMALKTIAEAYSVHNVIGGSFTGGTAASVVTGNWSIPSYIRSNLGFDWDIGVLPKGTDRHTILYPNGLFMGSTSANQDLAWEFIKFFALELEGARTWTRAVARIPSLRELGPVFVNIQRDLLDGVDYAVFVDAIEYARYPTTRRVPEASDIENILKQEWLSIQRGEISPAAGAQRIAHRITAALQNQ